MDKWNMLELFIILFITDKRCIDNLYVELVYNSSSSNFLTSLSSFSLNFSPHFSLELCNFSYSCQNHLPFLSPSFFIWTWSISLLSVFFLSEIPFFPLYVRRTEFLFIGELKSFLFFLLSHMFTTFI